MFAASSKYGRMGHNLCTFISAIFCTFGDFFKRSLFHVCQKKKKVVFFFFFLKSHNKESTQGKKSCCITEIHSGWWEDAFISFLFVDFLHFLIQAVLNFVKMRWGKVVLGIVQNQLQARNERKFFFFSLSFYSNFALSNCPHSRNRCCNGSNWYSSVTSPGSHLLWP